VNETNPEERNTGPLRTDYIEKAVIGRIVDGKTAVTLVGEDERQHHYRADGLPEGPGKARG